MNYKLNVLLLLLLLSFFSCKKSSPDKIQYDQNTRLIASEDRVQKDNSKVSETTNNDCKCAENNFAGTKTDTVYQLSNGKRIALCGYRNVENKPVDFSEFVLSVCDEKEIIDFWDATETCNLRIIKDTLIVEELVNLPAEKNRTYTSTIWSFEKFYFEKNQLKRKRFLNQKIRKYSQAEVAITLEEYESADEQINDEKIQLLNRLFIAIISGSDQARDYFKEFKNRYQPDGAFSEEYNDLTAMLEAWDRR